MHRQIFSFWGFLGRRVTPDYSHNFVLLPPLETEEEKAARRERRWWRVFFVAVFVAAVLGSWLGTPEP